jgi:predicted ThiF/HesA family dinucleotide-utilizing enzyme
MGRRNIILVTEFIFKRRQSRTSKPIPTNLIFSMKLTAEQIEYVENYIISKDIKWYELQIELTDHMITSMEEFWKRS